MNLQNTEPYNVAKAFFEQMYQYDSQINDTQSEPELAEDGTEEEKSSSESRTDSSPIPKLTHPKTILPEFLQEFIHVIQFCHLCTKGKVTPVLYSIASNNEINNWFSSLKLSCLPIPRQGPKRNLRDTSDTEDDNISSPDQKLSRKDHYLIHTMLKLHDTMDKNNLKQSIEKDEKEPGFPRLEMHVKNLILNASATPPFDVQATKPADFYSTFLSKKSQFKAKEMILHRFHLDKIAFNPNAYFIANLWHGNFFWLLPDSPSGVSIFFCPETKSYNAIELEKEKTLLLQIK